jgi:hypothetical protein
MPTVRRGVVVAGCSLASLAVVAGCDDPAPPPATTPSIAPAVTTNGAPSTTTTAAATGSLSADELRAGTDWRGTFTIHLEVWDLCASPPGSLERTRSGSYDRTESFTFATAAPFADGDGVHETNPFYVSGGTHVDDPGPVALTIYSAGLLAVDGSGLQPSLHQYWDLAYDGGRLTGTLVDDAAESGFDYNRFYDDDPITPCEPGLGMITKVYPMAEGATLTADLGAGEMTLVIEGASRDAARRFRIEATARRV